MDTVSDYVLVYCSLLVFLLLFALGHLARMEGYLRNIKERQVETTEDKSKGKGNKKVRE